MGDNHEVNNGFHEGNGPEFHAGEESNLSTEAPRIRPLQQADAQHFEDAPTGLTAAATSVSGDAGEQKEDMGRASSRPDGSAERVLVEEVLKRYREQKARSPHNPLASSLSGSAPLAAPPHAKKRPKTEAPTPAKGFAEFRAPSSPIKIDTPRAADVLFGRRDAQRFHPGNVQLRELCNRFRVRYESGDRDEKTAVTTDILNIIHGQGGRFLKRRVNESDWYRVDEEVAREKVAFTMRDTREKRK